MTALGAVMAVGGGNGIVAVVQNYWVRPGRLDPAAFFWVLSLSYVFPGPRAGFLAGAGYSLAGTPGAVAALVGVMVPACLSAAAVHRGMKRIEPWMRRMMEPAAFVIAGIILAAAWDLAWALRLSWWEAGLLGVGVYLAGPRDVEPVWLVLAAGALGILRALLLVS